jgi:hypothetical protein
MKQPSIQEIRAKMAAGNRAAEQYNVLMALPTEDAQIKFISALTRQDLHLIIDGTMNEFGARLANEAVKHSHEEKGVFYVFGAKDKIESIERHRVVLLPLMKALLAADEMEKESGVTR